MTPSLLRQRSEWLSRLGTSVADGEALRCELRDWIEQGAPLVEPHFEDVRSGPLELARHRWTADYFARQKVYTEANFSIERVHHLIEVRDHLRAACVRGFIPGPEKPRTSDPSEGMQLAADAAFASFRATSSLARELEIGDVPRIRSMLALELADRRLDDEYLRCALNVAKSRIAGLCEPYRMDRFTVAIEANRGLWTTDYFDRQSTFLERNFSQERFLHLVQVRSHLRMQGIPGFSPEVARPIGANSPAHTGHASSVTDSPTASASRGRGGNPWLKFGLLVAVSLAALIAVILARRD